MLTSWTIQIQILNLGKTTWNLIFCALRYDQINTVSQNVKLLLNLFLWLKSKGESNNLKKILTLNFLRTNWLWSQCQDPGKSSHHWKYTLCRRGRKVCRKFVCLRWTVSQQGWKTDVDYIKGLCPAIAIEQSHLSQYKVWRSEVSDRRYIRLHALFLPR